jgi:adenylate cyclase
LELAENVNIVRYQAKGCECLFEVYEQLGDARTALAYHKRFVTLNDSVSSEQKSKDITRIAMDHEFERQQLADSLERAKEAMYLELIHKEDLATERANRNIALFLVFGILLLAGALWSRLRYIRRSRAAITKEKDRSESLLHNILPEEIAAELKANGFAEAREFDNVSILFTDFKGFTGIAEKLGPKELVFELNVVFEAFDAVCENFGLEKIKTIGDSYMAVSGLPSPSDDSAQRMVHASLAMQEFLIRRKRFRDEENKYAFEMRAGIHTGSIVAGIVGKKKFQYDIWGDAVNTASRMESSGEAGEVNISETTYNLIKDLPEFSFTPRGILEVKGKGEMAMHFVHLR